MELILVNFGIATAAALGTGNANDFALHYFVAGAAAAGFAPNATELAHGQFLFKPTRAAVLGQNGSAAGGLKLIATLNTALVATDFELR